MKVLTSAQMREIDRRTIEEFGIPGEVLMENAALRLVSLVRGLLPEPGDARVVVVAGRGNNGGDGLAAARHLYNGGYDVEVILLAGLDDLRGEALLNGRVCRAMDVPLTEVIDERGWRRCRPRLATAGLLVDAIFGTGLSKPAGGLQARVIEAMNRSRALKISVDVPSGLASDSFQLIGPALRADITVALAAPKVCHVFPPSEDYVGELIIADIGVPGRLFRDEGLKLEMVDAEALAIHFRKRPRDSHKGTYGHVLVIGGSRGKSGAAILAGRAALKMGAGLVTLAVPAGSQAVVARSTPEYMTEPLEETPDGTIAEGAAGRAAALCRGKNAVVLGPGLTTHPSTARFVRTLISKIKLPLVIDADGLNVLSGEPGLFSDRPSFTVLTPHPGEFGRLTGLDAGRVLERRLDLAPEFASKHSLTLVLKGHRTLTATPDGRVFINSTGNPGLASGGSGDVLSGMLGGQLAQVKDRLAAVLSSVYAHGLAGDLAAKKLGQRSLTASDIIRFLPAALKALEDRSSS